MRIKLLIATGDDSYAGCLSNHISEHHSDVIDVVVCRTRERFAELLAISRFDAALLDESMVEGADLSSICLPLLLWAQDECDCTATGALVKIRKYQRISSIVTNVLEQYSKVSKSGHGDDFERASITAVWSPAGGVGKTSVALACAAGKASCGKQVLYLDMEPFSGASVYFAQTGKSISTVFEMLENREGDIKTLIRGVSRLDSDSGVAYFCCPGNYDDMNILTVDDVSSLIDACAAVTDELVIDMSCVCDERARRVFELADRVLVVVDQASTTQAKLAQFSEQHNVFTRIKAKMTLVANKGAAISAPLVDAVVRLPYIQSANERTVFKTLSGSSFDV